ncbi:MAG: hypothetical protein PHQ81_01405 [Methanofollis sp.]|nr:hypothetical protein [Methanofollis sp.]
MATVTCTHLLRREKKIPSCAATTSAHSDLISAVFICLCIYGQKFGANVFFPNNVWKISNVEDIMR